MIKGSIGSYKPATGYVTTDYVLHNQLSSLFNDIRKFKSVVDNNAGSLVTNTNYDLYYRVSFGVTSIIFLIFGFLFRMRGKLNKIRDVNGRIKMPVCSQLPLGLMTAVSVPRYNQTICPY